MPKSRSLKRLTVTVACALVAAGASQIPSSSADLSSQISANKSAAATLQSEITSETAQIQKTANGVAIAQQQLDAVNARLDTSIANLKNVQQSLLTERQHLLNLENRMTVASRALAANLRTEYEQGSPNIVDVILNAHGFSSLLDQVNFMKRVQSQDREILAFTVKAKAKVLAETRRLGILMKRDHALTVEIIAQRNHANAIEFALQQEQINEESQRSGKRAHLAKVQSEIATQQHQLQLAQEAAEKKLEESQAQQQTQVNTEVGVAVDSSSGVTAPPGAPAAVVAMITAGNSIATLPYIWGGGHGSFFAPGYDCSGSVSFVLRAAGLLDAPEVSGDFESYGDPGPGKWVTIYASEGHVWMTIAGWRFDTVALAEGGTRWSRGGGEYGGFVVRHPPGL